ncbi:MAG: aldo/keto reductase [Nocardioides sp.]
MDKIHLNDDTTIPRIGFGVFRVPDDLAATAVEQAIDVGYRAIDTAAYYQNEPGTGRGIAASGCTRTELHVTTKVWHLDLGYDLTAQSVRNSLTRLNLDYLDSVLIHWPVPSRGLFVDSWHALIDAKTEGLTRSIGVSNFNPPEIETLITQTGVTPAVNQVEMHPRLAQPVIRSYDNERRIVTQAWSPLGHGTMLDHPVVTEIAAIRSATPAQVLLSWSLAQGVMPLTKTLDTRRMADNLRALDLELTQEDRARISTLNDGHRTGPDPATYGT